MSRIKHDGCFFRFESGDKSFDDDNDNRKHRTIDNDELTAAINAESIASRLFARVVKTRSNEHSNMINRFGKLRDVADEAGS